MIDKQTRLHISPFSPDLLSAIFPSSSLGLAQHISYHTLQTFPENSYGYLELPSMEAEKIKKKLNGSILKGKKIRIEEARPLKRQREEGDDSAQVNSKPAPEQIETRSSKRSKKTGSTLNGRELSPDRKVKRGWTEPKNDKPKRSKKDKVDQAPSKYTDKEELLFKTKLPLNRTINVKGEVKKKSKGKGHDALVHEFSKSTIQPSFLRENAETSNRKKAAAYIDGKGWVDDDGTLVEEERLGRKTRAVLPSSGRSSQKTGSGELEALSRESGDDTSDESRSESGPDSSDSDDEPTEIRVPKNPPNYDASSTSSSDASETSGSRESSSQPSASAATEPEKGDMVEMSSNPVDVHVASHAIHPLEALFKRPATKSSSKPNSTTASQEKDIPKPSLELQTTFSFFGPGDSTEEPQVDQLDAIPREPATPFTSLDFHYRTLRSAAPTPDTAAPSRFNSWGHGRSSESSSSPSSLSSSSSENATNTSSDDGKDREARQKNRSNTKSKTTKPETVTIATRKTKAKINSDPKKAPTSHPAESAKGEIAAGAASAEEEKEGGEESAFSKAFWEGRGEFNRGWKKRRRGRSRYCASARIAALVVRGGARGVWQGEETVLFGIC